MNEAMTIAAGNAIDGQYRDINTLRQEITILFNQALESELIFAIKLGRKLTEAKSLVNHGEWGTWVEENLPFGQDKAGMMMKIYENYGSQQENIFGEINSDTYRNLGVWQAFALLKVPESEREEFVKENRADEMSVRELRQAIKDRDAALKAKEKAEQEAEQAKKDNGKLWMVNNELQEKAKAADQAKADAEAAKRETERAKADAAKAKTAAETARAAQQAAEHALKIATENPKVPQEVIDKLTAEAKAAAQRAADTEITRAKAEAAQAKAEAEELQRKLKTASPNVAIFQQIYNDLRDTINKAKGALMKVENESPETAEKLRQALKSVGNKLAQEMEA